MLASIKVESDKMDGLCYYDYIEGVIACDDLYTKVEVHPKDVEFDRYDLEHIVDRYYGVIIDILLKRKEELLETLQKYSTK